jgi:phospholipase/carboxylesterase
VLALPTHLPLCERLAVAASAANRNVPVLMCHGRFDPVVPLQYGGWSRDACCTATDGAAIRSSR